MYMFKKKKRKPDIQIHLDSATINPFLGIARITKYQLITLAYMRLGLLSLSTNKQW